MLFDMERSTRGPVLSDTKVGGLGEGSFGQVLLVRGKVRPEAVAMIWCLCP